MSEEKAKCEKCGKDNVSAKVEAYSREHFDNHVYCYDCQQLVDGDVGVETTEEGAKKGTLEGYVNEGDEELEAFDEKLGAGKVVDVDEGEAEVVPEQKQKLNKSVEIDEGAFMFREEGGKLFCRNGANDNEYELDVKKPYCSCGDFVINKEKREWCGHLKAASIAGYKVTKLQGMPEKQEQTKEIDIEWDKIPPHILLSKLEGALNYEIIKEEGDGAFRVIMIEGGVIHYVRHNSCDCRDWINRGTSLNPCVHQVRIRYDDDEINEKLKELQPNIKSEQLSVIKQKQQPSVFGGISQLQPRLCETGKIKIGELSDKRTGSGRRLPKKLDHFVITTLLRDEEGNLLLDEEMAKKIGEDCKELDIYLCYDSPELNMPTFYAYFTQSKLRCMGDGKTALKTKDDGGKEEITCNPKTCDAYKKKLCKPYGRLSVILSQANRIGGAYIFRTTSWNTLRNILTSMSFIRTITGGILAGLPLKMRLIPMQVQPRDLGHTVRIYMVNIEFNGDMKQLMESAEVEAKRRIQMGTDMRQIEAGDRAVIAERVREEAEEQATEIAEEFLPDK